MSSRIIPVLFILFFIAIIGVAIWYSIYFSQNCLKSHIHRYMDWNSVCVSRTKSGVCTSSVLVPTEKEEQICDLWRKN